MQNLVTYTYLLISFKIFVLRSIFMHLSLRIKKKLFVVNVLDIIYVSDNK